MKSTENQTDSKQTKITDKTERFTRMRPRTETKYTYIKKKKNDKKK